MRRWKPPFEIPNIFRVLAVFKTWSLFSPIPATFSHFFYICSCTTHTILGTYILLTILRDLLFTTVENFAYFLRLGLFKPSVMQLLLTAHQALQGRPCATLALACSVQCISQVSMDKCSYLIYTAPVLGPHFGFWKKYLEKYRKKKSIIDISLKSTAIHAGNYYTIIQ